MGEIDFTTIPNKLSEVLDEAELAHFIQDSLLESGTVIASDDAREVAEIAFDYVAYKLTEQEGYNETN